MAEILPFPPARRFDAVDRHASAMRGMSVSSKEFYITDVIERAYEEYRKLGVDCDRSEEALIEFIDAIGEKLHGSSRARLGGAR